MSARSEAFRVRFRTGVWFVLVPGVMGWLVPWWLDRWVNGPWVWTAQFGQWVGIWLILDGVGMLSWCVWLFVRRGRGTPLPLNPPKRFVAEGPYRFVRNPMALGMLLILGGEAALYDSVLVFCYLLAAAAGVHLYVWLVEEPQLSRRFGPSYTAYKRDVPRWIPKTPRAPG